MIGAAFDRLLWRTVRPIPAHPQTRRVLAGTAALRIRDSGGSGPALVFLCDPPVTVEAYDELIGRLEADYRVLVIELPGFGFSRADSARAAGFDASVAAIEQALTALAAGAMVLFGPCICGFVAAELVRRGRLPVRGLVLMQTPDSAGMRAWAERTDPRRLLRTPLLGQLLVRVRARRIVRFWLHYATPKAYDEQPLAVAVLGALEQGGGYPLATMLQDWNRSLRDAALEVPALLVWGRQDRSHRDTDPGCSRAHAPAAGLVELAGCGHFSELENPAAFIAAAEPFLQQCLAGGTPE